MGGSLQRGSWRAMHSGVWRASVPASDSRVPIAAVERGVDCVLGGVPARFEFIEAGVVIAAGDTAEVDVGNAGIEE